MIPNHPRFIEAIHNKNKVCVRFYFEADNGPLDRVCAPMDYGPGSGFDDGLNRYWLWDYANKMGSHTLGLVPQQIMDMQVLGDVFDPADLKIIPTQWSVAREWGLPRQLAETPAQAADSAPVVAATPA